MLASSVRRRAYAGTIVVLVVGGVYALLFLVAEPPGFAQFPSIPLADRPIAKKTNAWREAAWWILHPGVGTGAETYSMWVQPNMVDGLRACFRRVASGTDDEVWDPLMLFPPYPQATLLHSRVVSYGHYETWGGSSVETSDAVPFVRQFYAKWAATHGWKLIPSLTAESDSSMHWQKDTIRVDLTFTTAAERTCAILAQKSIKI